MKKLVLIATIFAYATVAKAQEFKQSLDGIEWVKIESKSDIVVKTHNSNELLIQTKGSQRTPKRAKSLKLIEASGTDNTDVGFYVIKEGNNLIVRNLKKGHATILLPAKQNISITTSDTSPSGISISGFRGEIEANAKLNGGIKITDASGPITANSLNGGIDIVFSAVSQDSPITVYSTNGTLDISLPNDTPANLSLGSTNGAIHSSFELSTPKKNGMRAISSQRVKGAINNGGVQIQLKTTNGDIYLRKE